MLPTTKYPDFMLNQTDVTDNYPFWQRQNHFSCTNVKKSSQLVS
ncbi:Uncharacterised protein [Legionella sainthelensi]|nr:Uncharacterised protein [Legionella sainthelensi]